MAGHSKWANIKHRKGRQDAQRSKLFSKLGKELMVAAKLGGDDPEMNPRLRLAIATAKGQSMPKDAIERAINKGAGNTDGEEYFEIRYEGYGPGGVAFIVDALSDNKNRTAGDVRSIFFKNDGNLGENGSVAFMFDRIGQVLYPPDKASADDIFEAAVDVGASNVESDEDGHEIICAPDDFATVSEGLTKKYGDAEQTGLAWKANVSAEIKGVDQARAVMKLIEALEDLDDVQHVTTNMDISEETMEKIASDS